MAWRDTAGAAAVCRDHSGTSAQPCSGGVWDKGTGVQGLALALLSSCASGIGVVASACFDDASSLVMIKVCLFGFFFLNNYVSY